MKAKAPCSSQMKPLDPDICEVDSLAKNVIVDTNKNRSSKLTYQATGSANVGLKINDNIDDGKYSELKKEYLELRKNHEILQSNQRIMGKDFEKLNKEVNSLKKRIQRVHRSFEKRNT